MNRNLNLTRAARPLSPCSSFSSTRPTPWWTTFSLRVKRKVTEAIHLRVTLRGVVARSQLFSGIPPLRLKEPSTSWRVCHGYWNGFPVVIFCRPQEAYSVQSERKHIGEMASCWSNTDEAEPLHPPLPNVVPPQRDILPIFGPSGSALVVARSGTGLWSPAGIYWILSNISPVRKPKPSIFGPPRRGSWILKRNSKQTS